MKTNEKQPNVEEFRQCLARRNQLRTSNIHGSTMATMEGPQASSVLHAFEGIRYRQDNSFVSRSSMLHWRGQIGGVRSSIDA
jgi:hypothetical protein